MGILSFRPLCGPFCVDILIIKWVVPSFAIWAVEAETEVPGLRFFVPDPKAMERALDSSESTQHARCYQEKALSILNQTRTTNLPLAV